MDQQRYAAEFVGEHKQRIDVVYWHDGAGRVAGEAYFHADDYCAPIVNGEFNHPYSSLAFKLHVPSRFSGKCKDAVLDVLRWANVGRCQPVACPVRPI